MRRLIGEASRAQSYLFLSRAEPTECDTASADRCISYVHCGVTTLVTSNVPIVDNGRLSAKIGTAKPLAV